MEEPTIQWPGQLLEEIYGKGIEGGFQDSIVELTVEAYQAFLAGFNRSPVILSGEALQRLNCEYILQYTKAVGEIAYWKKNFELQSRQISEDFEAASLLLNKFTLFDTIVFLEEQKLIGRELVLDMHALRHLRNNAVHSSRQPRFDPFSPTAEYDLKEIARLALSGSDLPLEFRMHKFTIRDSRQEIEYIVDQEKLGINIEKARLDQRVAVIALALLFATMKHLNLNLPPSGIKSS